MYCCPIGQSQNPYGEGWGEDACKGIVTEKRIMAAILQTVFLLCHIYLFLMGDQNPYMPIPLSYSMSPTS